MIKACTKCGESYTLAEFHRFKRSKDGRHSWCKYCIKSYKQRYVEKNRKKINDRNKYNPERKYSMYKSDAKRRGMEFKITKEEFVKVITQNCHYCGKLAKPVTGVDRIDSTQGYLKENIIPCCKNCNRAKMDLSYGEFIRHIHKMYHHLKLGGTQ